MTTGARPAPIILGCADLVLSADERKLFAEGNPLGLILFGRNIDGPAQVTALVRSFREIVGRNDAPVLIDQEGGRVARLKKPHWPLFPPAARYGELYARDAVAGIAAAEAAGRIMADELSALGVDVDCAPVVDLPVPGSHGVIGDRAFSEDPEIAILLAGAFNRGMLAGGVLPMIKHIPGHGRARADSHAELPQVDATLADLRNRDFVTFKGLNSTPWAMTAHVTYTALDPSRCASLSPIVINQFIRGEIGFDGVLISDDIIMKALSGSMADRARGVIDAGCDLALHCSGDIGEMRDVLAALPAMNDKAVVRLARASAMKAAPQPYDRKSAEAAILAAVPVA